MEPFRRLSTSEQIADYLRRQIHEGTLVGELPGVQRLVKTLGVNSEAVGKAVDQLEREGLVIHQGNRKSRLIVGASNHRKASLRVGILLYEKASAVRHDVLSIKQELMKAGHTVIAAPKALLDLGMRVDRVARQVQSVEVDAWVIVAGSAEILEWFEQQKIPAFALHGRLMKVNLAGVGIRKTPVLSTVIEKLAKVGHRRIVLLTRQERREPQLGFFERSFLEELEKQGIRTGAYNIPDWKDTPEGLEEVIHSLFQTTPPTALVVSDSVMLHATQLHLAAKGIFAPRDVSLFCNDFEESFRWARPEVAHIEWNLGPMIRRISQWADNVFQGKEDTKKNFIKAHLYEGGTLGSSHPPQAPNP